MDTNAGGDHQAAPPLLRELAESLRITGNNNATGQVVNDAIRAWIDADKAHQPRVAEPCRGYQWKSLFLPGATELRMTCADATFHARVVGDQIIYQGRSASPRGMPPAVAGEGRNAWRAMAAVATAMSNALKTALALVEHTSAQAAHKVERRGQKHRRESDKLDDECRFD